MSSVKSSSSPRSRKYSQITYRLMKIVVEEKIRETKISV